MAARLPAVHLQQSTMCGGAPAGPAPAPPALPRAGPLPPGTVVEADRTVDRNGYVQIRTHLMLLGARLAGSRVALRLDDHLIHVVRGDRLVQTQPSPVRQDQRIHVRGARIATTPLPPRPAAGPPRVQRRVPRDGVIMVARQRLQVGHDHAHKTVTILIEDTHFLVMHDGHELSRHRPDPGIPVRHVTVHASRPGR